MITYAIDIETYAPNLTYDSFMVKYMEENQASKLTKAYYDKAKKSFLELRKEIALDPKRNAIRLLQVKSSNDDVMVYDFFEPAQKEKAETFIKTTYTMGYIVAHNFKFDGATIYNKYKVMPAQIFDTMIASRLIYNFTELPIQEKESNPNRISASLQNALFNFIGISLSKEHGGSDWSTELNIDQIKYAKDDVEYLHQLAEKQVSILNNGSTLLVKDNYMLGLKDFISVMEMKFLKDLIKIELNGVPVNRKALLDRQNELKLKLAILDSTFTINPNSSQQVISELKKLGITTQTANADFLKTLDIKFAKDILDIKRTRKLITDIDKYIKGDRVYTNFNQILRSGRMSSDNENVQQINRELKKIFYADDVIEADYSSAELFIAAYAWKVNNLYNVFVSGKDAHKTTGNMILGVPYDEITKEQRTLSKGVTFGSIYGAGTDTVQTYIKVNYGIDLTIKETEIRRNKFFEAYPQIRQRHIAVGNELSIYPKGIITRTLLGRRALSDKYTVSINSEIQGSGADALKIAVILYMNKYDNIVSLVHDSIVLDVHSTDEQVTFLKECMVRAMRYVVPTLNIEVDIKQFKESTNV